MSNVFYTVYRRMDGTPVNTDIWTNFCAYTRKLSRRLDDELLENWRAVFVGTTLHFETEEDLFLFVLRWS